MATPKSPELPFPVPSDKVMEILMDRWKDDEGLFDKYLKDLVAFYHDALRNHTNAKQSSVIAKENSDE